MSGPEVPEELRRMIERLPAAQQKRLLAEWGCPRPGSALESLKGELEYLRRPEGGE